MDKQKVALLLFEINKFYPQFDFSESKVDSWHRVLKNQDYDKSIEKLDKYVLKNNFPPVVSDLYVETKLEGFIDWDKLNRLRYGNFKPAEESEGPDPFFEELDRKMGKQVK